MSGDEDGGKVRMLYELLDSGQLRAFEEDLRNASETHRDYVKQQRG